ncbi:MAG: hypothetical protein ACR2MX_12300 [Cyclobacteriaceae bacterium]
MEKLNLIITLVWLMMGGCSLSAFGQTEPEEDGQLAEHQGLYPIDVQIIETHASDLKQLRHMTLDRYRHVLEQIRDQIIQDPSDEEAELNMGPTLLMAIADGFTASLKHFENVPGISEVIQTYESVNEKTQVSIGYQIEPDTRLWILEAIDQVEEMVGFEYFDDIVKEQLLEEIKALPADSDERADYSESLAKFHNLGIRFLVLGKEELEFNAYIDYLNQRYAHDKKGHVFFDFEMKGGDNQNAGDWTSEDVAYLVVGVEAPFGWEIAQRLNDLNQANGFYNSLLELKLTKIITFFTKDDDTLAPPKAIYAADNSLEQNTASEELIEFVINQQHPYCGEFEY